MLDFQERALVSNPNMDLNMASHVKVDVSNVYVCMLLEVQNENISPNLIFLLDRLAMGTNCDTGIEIFISGGNQNI